MKIIACAWVYVLRVEKETQKAALYLFQEGDEEWIPKSAIVANAADRILIPFSLIRQKGLLPYVTEDYGELYKHSRKYGFIRVGDDDE